MARRRNCQETGPWSRSIWALPLQPVSPPGREPPHMVEPLLDVRDLAAGYAGRDVLFGLNCRIWSGELVAMVGPNGHGKTTLLRAISGLVRPSRGEILFAGKPLAR